MELHPLHEACFIGCSIFHLCPNSVNPLSAPIWDFSSIATLGRNLFEAVAFFDYFSEPVSDEEWNTRYLVMELNDNRNRVRMFEQFGMAEHVTGFETNLKEIAAELQATPFFARLSKTQQKRLLGGTDPALRNLRERAQHCATTPVAWGVYDYLSSHAHSLPISFMRVRDQKRDGSRNDAEELLLGSAVLPFTIELLNGCRDRFEADRAELHVFSAMPEGFETTYVF